MNKSINDQIAVNTKKPSKLQTAALVFGILGFFVGFLSIFAIIFGAITLKERPNIRAKWGLRLGIIAFILSLLFTLFLLALRSARQGM